MPHPVEIIGKVIAILTKLAESFAGEWPWKLRISGLLITIIVVSLSGSFGWAIERLALQEGPLIRIFGNLILLISLTSCLAAGSLRRGVKEVLIALPKNYESSDLDLAKEKLSLIVGRNVKELDQKEILRAVAETTSENSVDGIFAPLFWMVLGAGLWCLNDAFPGPLTLAWIFKASSTIDSMIGYREGKLKWLGTAGAKLDDLLTWIPCRLVFISLPLISKPINQFFLTIKAAWKEGIQDLSPNSGLSESIFAHCAGVQMGGTNWYKGKRIEKQKISGNSPIPNKIKIDQLLNMSLKLEIIWLAISVSFFNLFFQI